MKGTTNPDDDRIRRQISVDDWLALYGGRSYTARRATPGQRFHRM